MENEIYLTIIGFISPVALGIIGFFIKRLTSNHDKHGEKIVDIEKNYVKKEELEKREKDLKNELQEIIKERVNSVKEDIKAMKQEFNENNNKTLEAVSSLAKQVNDIQLNYISKEDFLRQNLTLSTKIDKLTEMLIEKNKSS